MYGYCDCGLLIASEIDLPGLLPVPLGDGTPDVTIRRAHVPTTLEDAIETGPNWQIGGSMVLVRVPGIVSFAVNAGNEIVVAAEAGTPPQDLAIFILTTAFPILLHRRRQIILRASAVRVGDAAVLFCGSPGAGKSTMAAALGERGYAVLSDDVCRIVFDVTGTPIVQPDRRQLILWADSIRHLDLADRRGGAVRTGLDKSYVEPRRAFPGPLPLAAVYMLRETRPPFDDGIEPPNVIDTTRVIHDSAYHPRMVAATGQKIDYFQSAAAISTRADVSYLTRPLAFADMAAVVARLEAHWRMIGLVGGALS